MSLKSAFHPYPWFRLLVAVLWLGCLYVSFSLYNNHPEGAGDYKYYFRGSQRILNGLPLYEGIDPAGDYIGPALVIQVVLPLVALTNDFRTSANLWFLVDLAAVIAALSLIAATLPSARSRLMLWGAMALSMPLIYSLWAGQVTTIMLLFMVGAWYSYRKGNRIAAGALLAIIVWTKFYPGLLLVYFLWKRDWRVVASAAVTTVLVILFQMTLVGFEGFIRFFTDILPPLVAVGQPLLNGSNNSVLGFAQRLFAPAPGVIMLVESPLMVSLTRYGLTGLLLFSVFSLSAKRLTNTRQFDMEYSLTLLVAMLLGSTLGVQGMLVAILPMVVILQSAPLSMRRTVRWGVALAYLLINIHLFIVLGFLSAVNPLPALVLSMPFFGMMLLWGMTVWTRLSQNATISKHSYTDSPATIEEVVAG